MTRISLIIALAGITACGEQPAPVQAASAQPVAEPVAETTIHTPDYGNSLLADGVPSDALAAAEPTLATEEAPVEGEVLTVEAQLPMVSYALGHGETLDHFARWSNTPVEELAALSGLSLDGHYQPGTEVSMFLDEAGQLQFSEARATETRERVERYLSRRGGLVGDDSYEVRTGDSAWRIARRGGRLPLWVVQAYNPETDLETIKPGDTLVLPVVGDVVAEAEE